ncbi:MAG: cyclic nucleotide-binding domain-containing protein [Elusimicrobia bacterium]|nr:cyclic nucleotide-binding domain-containing protein [Elusimicrobiota bacterium]
MTPQDFLQAHVPFLSGLTPDQAGALAAHAQAQTFNKGQTVLFKGTTIDGLYVVAFGKVSVWVKGEGKALVQVAELGTGEVFGEISILEMGTAGATIKASEDSTMILVIPQDHFRQVLAQSPQFEARTRALIEARKKKNFECLSPATA